MKTIHHHEADISPIMLSNVLIFFENFKNLMKVVGIPP